LDQFEQSFPDLSQRLLVKDEQDFRLPTYNETEEDARRRSTNWLRKYFKSQRALVITHESICNFLIRQLTGASKWSYTPLGFGSISVLESKNKQQWKLVKLNDTSFLSSGEICR
jgi:broad specificity phosphatase PhoE